MGFFSKLFGKKQKDGNVRKRENNPDVVDIHNNDEKMNWAIEKAHLTLHYFKDCLKQPSPEQQYFSVKVKIEDKDKVEHIWLTNPSFDGEGNLFGVIGNEPIDVTNVKFKQQIGINEHLLSDWMIIENGRLIGGYTIRAVRDSLSGLALQNFDKSLGGVYVDEGEDYFLPDHSTPEGAILKLEAAYNSDDIEKAIECKDFKKEAELMLSMMGKEGLGSDIVEKTAEILELSFIKALQENGIPKFENVKHAFPYREELSADLMIITEILIYPDGSKSKQRFNTYKSPTGWKVLNSLD